VLSIEKPIRAQQEYARPPTAVSFLLFIIIYLFFFLTEGAIRSETFFFAM
jgi:hypothetical protein